jgi:hypothetical protein
MGLALQRLVAMHEHYAQSVASGKPADPDEAWLRRGLDPLGETR